MNFCGHFPDIAWKTKKKEIINNKRKGFNMMYHSVHSDDYFVPIFNGRNFDSVSVKMFTVIFCQ